MQRAQERTGESVAEILAQLGLPEATYYRWQAGEQAGCLTDQVVVPGRRVVSPTPAEILAARDFALDHPLMGYKRLAWQMVDQDVAYLRPYQVYDLLRKGDLLSRRAVPRPEPLKRPAPPDRADEVWHIDLMYLYIVPRWYYLVDIVDGYSRFLVHWSLNLTMLADTVTLAVQEALDGLPQRCAGEPKLIHDRGGQFLSQEWREFVKAAGVTDIKTRVEHPQSNGVVERLHRTQREEGLDAEALSDYYRALEAMTRWSQYYNHERPHSALKYLCPIDYYRGDPEARLVDRQRKLAEAVKARKDYWADVSKC